MVLHTRPTLFLSILLLSAGAVMLPAQPLATKATEAPAQPPAVRRAAGGMDPTSWPVGPDGKRYMPLGKKEQGKRLLPDLKPDDPFITINQAPLTWGALHAHLDLLISNVRLPTGVTAKDLEDARDKLIMGRLRSVVRNYAYKTLLAQEARRRGITLTAQEVQDKQREVLDKLSSQNRNPERYLKVFNAPGSFFQADLTNSLLLAKLEQEILLPGIVITEADLDEALRRREETNRGLTVSNQLLRPRLQKLRKEILSGKDTFANAAYVLSECGSSLEYGEFGTTTCENLLPELVHALTNLTKGVISDVVETPHSFHLLKLNQLNRGFLKEGEKGLAPIVSINFAHIMFEKKPLLPPITRDALKATLTQDRLKAARDSLLDHLIAKATVTSAMAINLKSQPGKRKARKPGPRRVAPKP